LDRNLFDQTSWVKVHMAEYKIWSGNAIGVEEAFLVEEKQFGSDSPYRIGIWRVLAQSSKENFSLYRNKILEAFKDPLGADRVHAAETLAKLGLPLEELAPEAVTPIIKGEKNSLFVYTLWGMANSRGEEKSPNILFDFIKQQKGEKLPLMQSAYALRHYGRYT